MGNENISAEGVSSAEPPPPVSVKLGYLNHACGQLQVPSHATYTCKLSMPIRQPPNFNPIMSCHGGIGLSMLMLGWLQQYTVPYKHHFGHINHIVTASLEVCWVIVDCDRCSSANVDVMTLVDKIYKISGSRFLVTKKQIHHPK